MFRNESQKKIIAGLAAIALPMAAVLATPPYHGASAATATTTLSVTLTIVAGCEVASSPVAFVTASVLSTAVDVTGSVTVTCTNTTPYTVSLDAGGGAGATVAARRMTGPASATVTYSLYRDAARTQLWGETIGTDTAAGTGNGSGQALTVYGRVPTQTTPAPGSYTDSVNVTVTY
jgi:spore coat protein U-like protein